MMEHKGTKRLETQRLILRSFVPDQSNQDSLCPANGVSKIQ